MLKWMQPVEVVAVVARTRLIERMGERWKEVEVEVEEAGQKFLTKGEGRDLDSLSSH